MFGHNLTFICSMIIFSRDITLHCQGQYIIWIYIHRSWFYHIRCITIHTFASFRVYISPVWEDISSKEHLLPLFKRKKGLGYCLTLEVLLQVGAERAKISLQYACFLRVLCVKPILCHILTQWWVVGKFYNLASLFYHICSSNKHLYIYFEFWILK